MRYLLAVGFLVVGCSAESTSAPTSCKREDRVGTYQVTFVEQSGTCGKVNSQLVSFNPGTPGSGGAGDGCTVHSERWSENDCKLERDVTCIVPPGSVRTVAVTRVQAANASEITGTMTITISGPDACTGTYVTDAVRQ